MLREVASEQDLVDESDLAVPLGVGLGDRDGPAEVLVLCGQLVEELPVDDLTRAARRRTRTRGGGLVRIRLS